MALSENSLSALKNTVRKAAGVRGAGVRSSSDSLTIQGKNPSRFLGDNRRDFLVQATTPELGAGWYSGFIRLPRSDSTLDPDSDLDTDDFLRNGPEAYIVNQAEEGGATDPLTTPFSAWGRRIGALQGKQVILIDTGSGGGLLHGTSGLFPVAVTKTTGLAGDAGTPCSYKYNVYAWGTATPTLVSDTAVLWARPNGMMDPATHGIAFEISGTVYLLMVDEKPAMTTCPSP